MTHFQTTSENWWTKCMVLYDMRCSQWCCWRFHSFGMWNCIVGWEVSGISKYCIAFFFRVIMSKKNTCWTKWPWRLRRYGPCYNKSQQVALFLTFILVKNSTCFGQIYCQRNLCVLLYKSSNTTILSYLLVHRTNNMFRPCMWVIFRL